MLEPNNIYCGNSLEILKEIDNESVNCCVTSPPYWALRDYGVDGQLGLEPTFEEYIDKLCNIFDEVKRVLRKDGTCWVVIGDTYHGSGMCVGQSPDHVSLSSLNRDSKYNSDEFNQFVKNKNKLDYPKKSLIMIPFRFAIEMVNRGWILRNTIVWWKPNCMPASVKDRFTVDFEYVFFFVKNKKYWFDRQLEPTKTKDNLVRDRDTTKLNNTPGRSPMQGLRTNNYDFRNKRSVWYQSTKPFKEAHFAVYPEDLIETPILAGCPEGGVVLDPFLGSGTTCLVAQKLNRNYIGIELSEEYCKIAYNRIKNG